MSTLLDRIKSLRMELAQGRENALPELLLELGHAHIEQIPEEVCGSLELAKLLKGAKVLHHRLDKMERYARSLNDITDEWCTDEVACMYSCRWQDREEAAALLALLDHTEAKPATGEDPLYHELAALICAIKTRMKVIDAVLLPHKTLLQHYADSTRVSQLVLETLK